MESEFNTWSETHLNVRVAQVQIIGPEASQQLMVLYADEKAVTAEEHDKLAALVAARRETTK